MLLVISPYDKGSLGAIEKAIMASDLGINPTNDGTVIRLAFPPLTEERRKELVKVVRHKAEEGKVAVRNLRRAGRHELEALQKDGELSTDELERVEKDLEKITHDQVAADRPAARPQRARAAAGLRSDEPCPTTPTTTTTSSVSRGLDGLDEPPDRPEGIDEDPPSYHSGRVRIIGAEPAGDTVREVTGPVVDEHPELPHWNDAPTGQVPAMLDRSNGEEQPVAPPMWREEETDWEAQEEVFEPSMLSDDLPAVGALLGEQRDEIDDVERQPWHFESDDTLVIPPEPGFGAEPGAEPEPEPGDSRSSDEPVRQPEHVSCRSPTTSRSSSRPRSRRGRRRPSPPRRRRPRRRA